MLRIKFSSPRRGAYRRCFAARYKKFFRGNTWRMKIKVMLAVFFSACAVAAACSPALLLPQADAAEVYVQKPCPGAVAAGDFYIAKTDTSGLFSRLRQKDVLGMTLRFDGNNITAQELMDKLGVTRARRADIDGKECYYCFSPLLGEGRRMGGETINVQIVQSPERLLAGFPLIMGSY